MNAEGDIKLLNPEQLVNINDYKAVTNSELL
jgi:hypothetical protein